MDTVTSRLVTIEALILARRPFRMTLRRDKFVEVKRGSEPFVSDLSVELAVHIKHGKINLSSLIEVSTARRGV